jgi:hypothetical protein
MCILEIIFHIVKSDEAFFLSRSMRKQFAIVHRVF